MLKSDTITEYIREKKILKSSDLQKFGISKYQIKKLVDDKQLIRIGHGLYLSDWSAYDEFAIFQCRHRKAIFSMTSALYLHGLTDLIPKKMEVTVYTGYNAHRFPETIKVHFIKKALYDLGQCQVETPFANLVVCYDMERTICDLIIKRSKIEPELFSKALKAYTTSSQKNLRKLYTYAKQLNVLQKVQEIVEVLDE